jgi:predicted amidophosphoribosyltransferase
VICPGCGYDLRRSERRCPECGYDLRRRWSKRERRKWGN